MVIACGVGIFRYVPHEDGVAVYGSIDRLGFNHAAFIVIFIAYKAGLAVEHYFTIRLVCKELVIRFVNGLFRGFGRINANAVCLDRSKAL